MSDERNRIKLEEHLNNFRELSVIINDFINGKISNNENINECLHQAVNKSMQYNGFFTEPDIIFALKSLTLMLDPDKTKKWVNNYLPLFYTKKTSCKIGVVMAGNIPLVGFHDFFCVLISDNIFLGKLSQNDRFLLPAISEILYHIDSRYKNIIHFTEDKLQNFDAVISTGSNNTSRYFEYYFRKFPHIIRKNRNSIAVLNGSETIEQLNQLAVDIFSYFGLGCRNVSKIFVSEDFDFQHFINAMEPYSFIINHNKYKNNYDYYKTIFMMDRCNITDCGFFILNENTSIYSPVSVINYERYSDVNIINSFIQDNEDKIQCVVGEMPLAYHTFDFGNAQYPELWDYPDNIDTLKFLLNL